MPIEFICSTCGRKLRAPDKAAGRATKCPGCQAAIQVPEPVYEAEEVPAAPAPAAEAQAEDAGPPVVEVDTDPVVADDRRPCPMCGEMIKANAVKCRFCGEIFDPTLKRANKKKTAPEDTDLSAGEWALAILCSGIGCIMGIVWMIQGKPKGTKMFGVSILFVFLWNVLNVIVQTSLRGR
jgi:hypothetical protein